MGNPLARPTCPHYRRRAAVIKLLPRPPRVSARPRLLLPRKEEALRGVDLAAKNMACLPNQDGQCEGRETGLEPQALCFI
jgi:hypothetical protein